MTLKGSLSDLGGVAGSKRVEGNKEYIYMYFTAAVTAGTPYFVTFDGDEEYNPKNTAAATSTTIYQLVVFPTKTLTAAGWAWAQYKGDAEVLCDGTSQDVAKDDFLEVINAGVALIVDGTSGATTKTTGSVAIAQEAYATNAAGLVNVYLIGERVFCQAT